MLAGGFAVVHHPVGTVVFPNPTSLWVWGADTEGELGDNASVDKVQPHPNNVFFPVGTVLMSLTAGNQNTLVAGGSHSLAVDRTRNLWAWGHNLFGQVGNGHGGTDVFGPVQVCASGQTAPCTQFIGGVTATVAGGMHSLALDTFGNVWGWGYNQFGQLGEATGTVVPIWNVALFAQVNQHGRPPITAIAAGDNHSLALDSGGRVWAWGANYSGQLGVGSNDSQITFASAILSLQGTTITAIAAGGDHTLALDSQGNVWAWGDNRNGQLGIGSFDEKRNAPARLGFFPPNTRITRIAAGAIHSLGIDSSGSLWAWGANGNGQLGIGTMIDSFAPARVHFPDGTLRIVTVAAGGAHSLAVDANGNLWAWGFNQRGQLGNGTVIDSHVPARVIYPDGSTHPIVSIAAGTRHSLALESLSSLTF
jgi:alpha-tubulin suppressor-like RCC1 family protein